MTFISPNQPVASATQVAHWAFDSHVGTISARDGQGNMVMAIAAGPLFAQRLAAAFDAPRPVWPSYWRTGSGLQLQAAAQAA